MDAQDKRTETNPSDRQTDHYDYLIVGAGLFGSTFARLATDAGKKCLVIEERDHVGGNLYCEKIAGITVHMYGAHIFQTEEDKVWDFVNRYATWKKYGYGYIPEGGYNVLIENLLKDIPVRTGVSYAAFCKDCPDSADIVIYTGPIDAFFDCCHGRLGYSCLDIQIKEIDQEHYQDKAFCLQSRHPAWVQTVEFKYISGEVSDKTVVSWERIQDEWDPNLLPCRPSRYDGNGNYKRYLQYVKEAAKKYPNIVFCGRLGRYMPYNMPETIVEAMKLAQIRLNT